MGGVAVMCHAVTGTWVAVLSTTVHLLQLFLPFQLLPLDC